MRPATVARPSTIVVTSRITCVARMTLRRSMMSASAPAKSPSTSVGAVLAVCTSATISADGVIVAISHAATVACIV